MVNVYFMYLSSGGVIATNDRILCPRVRYLGCKRNTNWLNSEMKEKFRPFCIFRKKYSVTPFTEYIVQELIKGSLGRAIISCCPTPIIYFLHIPWYTQQAMPSDAKKKTVFSDFFFFCKKRCVFFFF